MSHTATVYRMVMDEHVCPYGLKSVDLLKREGFDIEDHPLQTREETERLMAQLNVSTTPQVFIDGERVGGYEALRKWFDKDRDSETSYQPVIAIFATTLLMALSTAAFSDSMNPVGVMELFVAFSMCVLGIQ